MEKIKRNIKLIYNWTIGIVGIILFVWMTFLILENVILSIFFTKYTICKPLKLSKGRYHTKDVEYSFKYKNRIYEGSKQYRSCDTSRSFIVRFSYVNPKINNILQDKQVPYGDWEIPPNGWEEIPRWVETVKQDY